MPKPIFIVSFGRLPATAEDKKQILNEVSNLLADIKKEYHTLITFEERSEPEIKFQMFSDKEIEPIELEKLKEILNLK